MRVFTRAALVGGTVTAMTLFAAVPALAHVTVDPSEAEQGGYAVLTLRVPNESPTAGTVKVQVDLPKDTPFASARVKPHQGWTATVRKEKLPKPVPAGDAEVTEAVRSITWTAQKGTRIAPDQFEGFELQVGPLPEKESIAFPATQTYDDGEVVAWNQPMKADGTEPEHPAPLLTLTPASEEEGGGHHGGGAAASKPAVESTTKQADAGERSSSATGSTDDTARAVGVAGLVVGALGLLAGGFAVIAVRRRPNGSGSPSA